MSHDDLRRRVAREAARLMYGRHEPSYQKARRTAARRVLRGESAAGEMPSKREIRDQIRSIARSHEGTRRKELLRQMRLEALRLMELLREFQPRLVGGLVAGDLPPNGVIELHAFPSDAAALIRALEDEGLPYRAEATGTGSEPRAEIRVEARFPCEIALLDPRLLCEPLLARATGRPVERLSIVELQARIREQHAAPPRAAEPVAAPHRADRFHAYETLLLPLENVRENVRAHPEGDVLYHSLQVFELARQERPYDEEFLLAALLHDAGKAIDPREHEAAALEALAGWITPRTAWLIEHHGEALALRAGTLGARARRRLEASEDYEELLLLAECDAAGRQIGAPAPDVREALDYLRELAEACGE